MSRTKYLLCVRPDTDLEVGKLYRVVARRSDRQALADGLVRVIDDSGEDYLHPGARFSTVDLTPSIQRLIDRGRRAPARTSSR